MTDLVTQLRNWVMAELPTEDLHAAAADRIEFLEQAASLLYKGFQILTEDGDDCYFCENLQKNGRDLDCTYHQVIRSLENHDA